MDSDGQGVLIDVGTAASSAGRECVLGLCQGVVRVGDSAKRTTGTTVRGVGGQTNAAASNGMAWCAGAEQETAARAEQAEMAAGTE